MSINYNRIKHIISITVSNLLFVILLGSLSFSFIPYLFLGQFVAYYYKYYPELEYNKFSFIEALKFQAKMLLWPKYMFNEIDKKKEEEEYMYEQELEIKKQFIDKIEKHDTSIFEEAFLKGELNETKVHSK